MRRRRASKKILPKDVKTGSKQDEEQSAPGGERAGRKIAEVVHPGGMKRQQCPEGASSEPIHRDE